MRKRHVHDRNSVQVRINHVPKDVMDAARRISIAEAESMGSVLRRIFILGIDAEERRITERNARA